MIVLDTHVVSELMRPAPDQRVRSWVDGFPSGDLWLTSTTAAELLAGVAVLPDGIRKRRLSSGVGEVLARVFAGRVLPFDEGAAVEYARILAARQRAGAPIGTAELMIAATCIASGASRLATRNTGDFAGTGLHLVDPWTAAAD